MTLSERHRTDIYTSVMSSCRFCHAIVIWAALNTMWCNDGVKGDDDNHGEGSEEEVAATESTGRKRCHGSVHPMTKIVLKPKGGFT